MIEQSENNRRLEPSPAAAARAAPVAAPAAAALIPAGQGLATSLFFVCVDLFSFVLLLSCL